MLNSTAVAKCVLLLVAWHRPTDYSPLPPPPPFSPPVTPPTPTKLKAPLSRSLVRLGGCCASRRRPCFAFPHNPDHFSYTAPRKKRHEGLHRRIGRNIYRLIHFRFFKFPIPSPRSASISRSSFRSKFFSVSNFHVPFFSYPFPSSVYFPVPFP